ncbi:MAG: protein kinase [Arcanobacterium sp.]|nr:protein kinase [Arcanobacterium sp.]
MAVDTDRSGRIISKRFELVEPFDSALAFPHTQAWYVHDIVLNQPLRGLIIDPDFGAKARALDAARRTALLNDAHAVSIISAIEDADAAAIFTEIPPGTSLSAILTQHRDVLTPANVVAIIGELASMINTARHQGIRHLQLAARRIFLTDSADVVVDGFGLAAALEGVDTDRLSAELDSDETRGLSVFLAALLLGEDFPEDPNTHDAIVAQARALPELPDQIRDLLTREISHNGPKSPDEFMRQIVPWGTIDLSELPNMELSTDGNSGRVGEGGVRASHTDADTADVTDTEHGGKKTLDAQGGRQDGSSGTDEVGSDAGSDDVVLPPPHWPALPASEASGGAGEAGEAGTNVPVESDAEIASESAEPVDTHAGEPSVKHRVSAAPDENTHSDAQRDTAHGTRADSDPLVEILGEEPPPPLSAQPLWPSTGAEIQDADHPSAAISYPDARDSHSDTDHPETDAGDSGSNTSDSEAAAGGIAEASPRLKGAKSSLSVRSLQSSTKPLAHTLTKQNLNNELGAVSDRITNHTSRAVVVFFALLVLLALIAGILWLFRPLSPVEVEHPNDEPATQSMEWMEYPEHTATVDHSADTDHSNSYV